jgi:hypothetical protein
MHEDMRRTYSCSMILFFERTWDCRSPQGFGRVGTLKSGELVNEEYFSLPVAGKIPYAFHDMCPTHSYVQNFKDYRHILIRSDWKRTTIADF